MRRRLSSLAAVTAALLGCLAGSPGPAQARDDHSLTGAQWHRLHPGLCHTAGDHELR
jgi:hypothetical protein